MPVALSYNLHLLTARLDRVADGLLRRQEGVSYARFLALFAVSEGASSQRELATWLGQREPSTSRMVGVLVNDALLTATRTAGAGNRRRLALTEVGAELVERCGHLLEGRFEDLVARSGVSYLSYQRATRRLLDQIDADLQAMLPSEGGSMTRFENQELRSASAVSEDGTTIAYSSLGSGPGLIIVGGALSSGSDYLSLARILADEFEVHVMERRGRPGSGAQRPGHDMDDECADLRAVAVATGASAVFGHSFGGLVALETARRQAVFDQLFLYEPGVPLRGEFDVGWLEGYQSRMEDGDRRGAFAWMVKHAGVAPGPIGLMPLWCVRGVLRLAIRGQRWASMSALLEANLVEHRIQADLDSPNAERFATITAHTVLLAGSRSPDQISRALLRELAGVMPNTAVATLPGLGHLAPEQHPGQVAAALLAHRSTRRATW